MHPALKRKEIRFMYLRSKTFWSRTLALILTLAMLLTLAPAAFAADEPGSGPNQEISREGADDSGAGSGDGSGGDEGGNSGEEGTDPGDPGDKTPVLVTGINISGATSIKKGESTTLSASVSPENADNKNINWSSSSTSVATVSNSGQVSGVGVGTATITATAADGSNVSATFEIEVTAPGVTGVTLNPGTLQLSVGETQTLTAKVSPDDANQSVSWKSNKPDIATVDNAGKVTGVFGGTTTITVTTEDGGIKANCTVTVTVPNVPVEKIELKPTTADIEVKKSVVLKATITPADATDDNVTWTSSNPDVATVDRAGVVTGVAGGTAVITAKAGGQSAQCTINVQADAPVPVGSISLDKTSATIKPGETTTITATVLPADATERGIAWTVSDSSIATIAPNGNVVTVRGVKESPVAVTVTAKAMDSSEKSATCTIMVQADAVIPVSSITLDQTSATIGPKGTVTLKATVAPADATTKDITWTVGDSSIATIAPNGDKVTVTGVKNGSVKVTATATDGSGKSATCTITVKESALTLNKSTISIPIGGTGKLTLTNTTGASVTTQTSNTAAASASVSGTTVTITVPKTAKGGDTATLTFTAGDRTAECKVTVSEPSLSLSSTNLTLSNGKTVTLSVSGIPAGSTASTKWQSSNESYATVSDKGVVTAKATGRTVSITATTTINGKTYPALTCTITLATYAETIRYSSDGTSVVRFVASDFNRVCNTSGVANSRLDYIVFTEIPTSYGTLYYDYDLNTGRGIEVTASGSGNRYGYTASSTYGSRLIEDLTFVPKSAADRTVTLRYTGYSSGNPVVEYTGTVEIAIGASGSLNYTISKNGTLDLSASDFNSFFIKASTSGYSLDYVSFNSLPSTSQGTLYFKYDKNAGRNTAVTRGTPYYRSGTDALDDVTFVAAEGYSGTVSIPFTASNGRSGSGSTVSGTLVIKVGKGSGTAADITYTTDRNAPVTLSARDFNRYCEEATGDSRVDYVTFTLPSSNRGVLYSVYSSASGARNQTLRSNTRCYRSAGSGETALDDVTFVPANGYTGIVSISFTGYSTGSKKFTGTMKITVGKDAGNINYTATAGSAVTFRLSDFTRFCQEELGSNATLSYITFNTPAASKGILYYDYSSTSSTEVKDGTKYYRNQRPYLDQITFVPARGLTGSVSIPFYGQSTSGGEFEGAVSISYTAVREPGVIKYTTTGTPVNFLLRDFTNACDVRGGGSLNAVYFAIPDQAYGRLYNGYTSTARNEGEISPSYAYRVSGTPSLAGVVFVPRAGFSGVAKLLYTGEDKNGITYNGTIEVTVSAPTSSSKFADVGTSYSWAAPSVDYLYQAGVVTGTDATHFAPAQNITRGDFVLMLYRAFGLRDAGNSSFSDVPQNSYYAQAIASAKALGIAAGGGDGKFNPTAALTRQDAMLLIQRTLNATGRTMRDGNGNALGNFADRGKVSNYALGAVAALVQAGVIQGDGNRNLNPTGSLSRAEMATILHRVLTM